MGDIDPRTAQGGLHILIAGAGIGGLAAAIALRQQGHRVEVSKPLTSQVQACKPEYSADP